MIIVPAELPKWTDTATAWATCALVVVGIAQAGLFWWQLRLIRASLVDAKEAADAALEGAHAASESARVSQAQFTATFRPKLVVREFALRGVDDDKPSVRFAFANVGGSPARITQSNVTIHIQNRNRPLPAVPPYSDKRSAIGHDLLEAGSSREVTYVETATGAQHPILLGLTAHTTIELFVLGFIFYVDDIGVRRKTAFCRRYKYEEERFHLLHESDRLDYEYAD